MKKLTLAKNKDIENLAAGEWIEFDGEFIVMRDAAHKRLFASNDPASELPISLKEKIIFYAGPTSGFVNGKGVIGPTTSARMDRYIEPMLKLGVKGFLGKGPRGKQSNRLMADYKAVYLVTAGGAAALLSKYVKEVKVLAYEDLGPEAVFSVCVQGFPAMVATDSQGRSIFNNVYSAKMSK